MKVRFNLDLFLQNVIETTHLAIFFFVPLILWPATTELFELNKMYFAYAAAAILLFAEITRILSLIKPTIIRPRLALVGGLFLAALSLSTLFSVNQPVSLFGYYGRFHGGILSFVAYGIIYFSLTQRSAQFYLQAVKVSLISGFLVSIWGILEHYGIDASYWAQDVRARVFSTLGQPNWLAAYLAMLLPWALVFYLENSRKIITALTFILILSFYTAFIFTYSRGGNLGLAAGLIVFLTFLAKDYFWIYWKKLAVVAAAMVIITLTFASPFTSHLFGSIPTRVVNNLELGSETGNIRLLVWQSAWEAFQSRPLLGSGPETFGDIYYQFRPIEMNETGEWDFLFNKAHNEYLNYLATTGLVGTLTFLLLIFAFAYQTLKSLRQRRQKYNLFLTASLASLTTCLVQNIFGFTVVPLAILVVLNLGVFVLTKQSLLEWNWPGWIEPIQKKRLYLALILPLAVVLTGVVNLWRSDLLYGEGLLSNELGLNSQAEFQLEQAIAINPHEPNFLIQLSFVKAVLASDLTGSQSSEKLSQEAEFLANRATTISPLSLSTWQIKAQLLELLAETNQRYLPLAEQARLKTTTLAPTEPRTYLELAEFYRKTDRIDQAELAYLKANSLKSDWLPPILALGNLYLEQGDLKRGKIYAAKAKRIAPRDPQVIILSQKVGL